MVMGVGRLNTRRASLPARPARRATTWASSSRAYRLGRRAMKQIFDAAGQRYAHRRLMFSGATRADACGQAQSAMGPFYCPPDNKIISIPRFPRHRAPLPRCVRIELMPVRAGLRDRARDPSRENLLVSCPRCSTAARAPQGRGEPPAGARELQADCFAGIWAARADKQWQLIQPGDVEAAMRTAPRSAMTACRAGQGYVIRTVHPGSSEQRQRWFQTGLKSGTSRRAILLRRAWHSDPSPRAGRVASLKRVYARL